MSIGNAWPFYAVANAVVEAIQSCVHGIKRKVQGLRPRGSPAQQFERAARLVEAMDLEDSRADRPAREWRSAPGAAERSQRISSRWASAAARAR